MALPALAGWNATREALHQIALVAGAVRVAGCDPLPNDLHFSLDVTAGGLSTLRLNCGAVLQFDFEALQLSLICDGRSVFSLEVEGHSQMSLTRGLLAALGDFGCDLQPSLERVTSDTRFDIDRDMAKAYSETLSAVYTALARFRAKLSGCMTPLVLWPHHFDLGFLWFAADGLDEGSDPQIAYGFAPFSPGLERPYVYAYAWSKPTGYLNLPLDQPAQAISDGYTGLYAAYDKLRELEPFDAAVETMLMNYHQLAAAQLRS